jgi:DNA-directed RNA polymerase specialized sigma24 family protein
MIGDALIKMYSALSRKKYNFDTEANPFAYFTTIAFNAFINRIKKEERHRTAEKNYRDRLYEDIMSDPENGGAYVYVKPMYDDDDSYDQD